MPRLIDKNGTSYEIRRKKTTIGRLSSNDIVVDDHLVSRQHAQIIYDGKSFFIVDNLSLNGTYVNGIRVDEAKLADGDEIQIGGEKFRFEISTLDPNLMTGESDTTFHLSKSLKDFNAQSLFAEKINHRRRTAEVLPQELQALRTSHQNLLVLHRLSEAVNSTLNSDKLLESAATIISETFSSKITSISIWDDEIGALTPKAVKFQGEGDAPKYAYLNTLAERAVRDKLCIAAFNPQGQDSSGAVVRVASAMAVPLMLKDALLGLIYVDNSPGEKPFSEGELDLLIAMSHIISSAVENANLYNRLNESLKRIREQQAQLVQSEKLAGIGALAAGVAHEINNPLAGIMGMAEAILMEKNVDKIKEYASDILQYTQEAAKIVKDLQSYSKASRGEGLSPVNINEVIEDALRLASHTGMLKGIEVKCDLGEITYIMADGGELKQVFMNLIQNASQAMEGIGKLSFATWVDEGRVYAKVADNGPGIPEEHLDKIFDPFFTTKEQGTGLGLNIVYRIVTKFGGDIDCESRVGVGTVFTLSFPAGKKTTH